MMSKFGLTSVSMLLVLTVLAACGGGGGGGGGGSAAAPAGNVPRFAYVANYNDNTVSIYVVNASTGQLRHNGYVVAGNGPQSVSVDPSGKFAYVTNYSSHDVSAYRINPASGFLTRIHCTGGVAVCNGSNFLAGSFPISVTVDPTGKFAYVTNSDSDNISAYTIAATTGALVRIDADTTIAGVQNFPAGNAPRSVVVDPSGKFAYVANYISKNVSAYRIDAVTGALTPVGAAVGAGNGPTSVTIAHSGKFAYVTNINSSDVSVYRIDAATGALTALNFVDPTVTALGGHNPVSVTVASSGKFAYVANRGSGDVSAYTIDISTGLLTQLACTGGPAVCNGSNFIAGSYPSSVTIDPSGTFAYVTNWDSNSISAYTIDDATGALTALPMVAGRGGNLSMAMTHGTAAVTHTPKFAYVANAGSNDVSTYSINANTGALTSIGEAVGTGDAPLSVTVDPYGRFAYVVNASLSGSVTAYTINSTTGELTPAGSTDAIDLPLSVTVDPSGRFAYVVDRASENVLVYSIDAASGALLPVTTTTAVPGSGPVSISIDPTGRFAYVANGGTDNVSAYTISPGTGVLTPVGTTTAVPGSNPASISIDATGKFAYVANTSAGNVSAYTIDSGTGALTAVAGSPFGAGTTPVSITVDPSGKFAYSANYSGGVSAYSISAGTGALTAVAGSPFAAGIHPYSVAVDPSGKFAYVANADTSLILPGSVLVYTIDSTTGALTSVGPEAPAGNGSISVTTTGTIQ